jgi:hypothetical protein
MTVSKILTVLFYTILFAIVIMWTFYQTTGDPLILFRTL